MNSSGNGGRDPYIINIILRILPNGHVQIFDNGGHRRGPSRSRIIEVDISNNEIVWEYTGTPDISFYSYHISSAERQPNGNVVICEGDPGDYLKLLLRRR